MKKILLTILGFLLASTAYAINITVPAAPSSGYFLESTSTGAYVYLLGSPITSTAGNWTGMWGNATSGTYYPASNPLGFVTSTGSGGGLATSTPFGAGMFLTVVNGNTVNATSAFVKSFNGATGSISYNAVTSLNFIYGDLSISARASGSVPLFEGGGAPFYIDFPMAGSALYAPSTTIPTNTNQLTNGAGFITTSTNNFGGIATSTYNASMTIATAAPLGGGGQLSNNGTLNLTCTGCLTTSTGLTTSNFSSANISQWTNNAGYSSSTLSASGTIAQLAATGNNYTVGVSQYLSSYNNNMGFSSTTLTASGTLIQLSATGNNYTVGVNQNLSAYNNNAGFITSDAPGVATTTITLSTTTYNGPTFTFSTSTSAGIFNITGNGTTFTWTIPPKNDQYFAPSTTIATNNNQLTNGAGYLTSGVATTTIAAGGGTATGNAFTFSTSTKAGSFNVTSSNAIVMFTIPPANDQYFAPSTTIATNNNQLTNGAAYLTGVTADSPLGGAGTSASHLTCTGCLTSAVTSLNTLTGALTLNTAATTSAGFSFTTSGVGGTITLNVPSFLSTSTGLTTSNFSSANISQWTNNAGYSSSTLTASGTLIQLTATGNNYTVGVNQNLSSYNNNAGFITATPIVYVSTSSLGNYNSGALAFFTNSSTVSADSVLIFNSSTNMLQLTGIVSSTQLYANSSTVNTLFSTMSVDINTQTTTAELFVTDGDVASTTVLFQGIAAQTGDLFRVQSSTGSGVTFFSISGSGSTTIPSTGALTLAGLTSQNCLGTDANGAVQAGTCSSGSGGLASTTPFTAGSLVVVSSSGNLATAPSSTIRANLGYLLSGNNFAGVSFTSAAVNVSSTVASSSIPGNLLGTNGCVHFAASGYYDNNSVATRTIRPIITFGGTIIWDAGASPAISAAATHHSYEWDGYLCNNNATNAQRLWGSLSLSNAGNGGAGSVGNYGKLGSNDSNDGSGFYTSYGATGAIDTTSARTLQLDILMSNSASTTIDIVRYASLFQLIQ